MLSNDALSHLHNRVENPSKKFGHCFPLYLHCQIVGSQVEIQNLSLRTFNPFLWFVFFPVCLIETLIEDFSNLFLFRNMQRNSMFDSFLNSLDFRVTNCELFHFRTCWGDRKKHYSAKIDSVWIGKISKLHNSGRRIHKSWTRIKKSIYLLQNSGR